MYTKIENYSPGHKNEDGTRKEEKSLETITLGRVKFSRDFKIEVGRLNLRGDITETEQEGEDLGYIEFVTNDLYIYRDTTLKAKHIFLFANNTIDLDEGV